MPDSIGGGSSGRHLAGRQKVGVKHQACEDIVALSIPEPERGGALCKTVSHRGAGLSCLLDVAHELLVPPEPEGLVAQAALASTS